MSEESEPTVATANVHTQSDFPGHPNPEEVCPPEFVGFTCDRCGREGYVHEHFYMYGPGKDADEVICGDCGSESE